VYKFDKKKKINKIKKDNTARSIDFGWKSVVLFIREVCSGIEQILQVNINLGGFLWKIKLLFQKIKRRRL